MQSIEDFIIDLIKRGDHSDLDRIPSLLQSEIVRHGPNASRERDRIARSVADRAPRSELADRVVDLIRAQNE